MPSRESYSRVRWDVSWWQRLVCAIDLMCGTRTLFVKTVSFFVFVSNVTVAQPNAPGDVGTVSEFSNRFLLDFFVCFCSFFVVVAFSILKHGSATNEHTPRNARKPPLCM